MTDAVEIALIVGCTGAIPAVITAILGFVNAAAIRRTESHVQSSKNTMETLEKNTNSIKDALVRVTGESEFAKGKLEGSAEANAKHAEAASPRPKEG